jgi:hypothetical protein
MRMLVMLTTVLLVACGSNAGAPCSTPNATECAGGKTLLVCEGGAWAAYPCPSCAGTTCDWKGALAGDACPRVAETYGTCPFDGRAVSCFWSSSADAGVFVETACSACVAGKSLVELNRCGGGRCTCQ